MSLISRLHSISQPVAALAFALALAFVLGGCERQGGATIDEQVVRVGEIEFLIARNEIKHYSEFSVSFWCRSSVAASQFGETTVPESYVKAEFGFAQLQPKNHRGEGWKDFGGYGTQKSELKTDDPLRELVVLGKGGVFLTKNLTLTLDGCQTIIRLNQRSGGAMFYESMWGHGIRYPENNYNFNSPLLIDFSWDQFGGCFEVNRRYYIEAAAPVKYFCTRDRGLSWTTEPTRDPVNRQLSIPLTESERAERLAALRDHAALVQCRRTDGFYDVQSRIDCPEYSKDLKW